MVTLTAHNARKFDFHTPEQIEQAYNLAEKHNEVVGSISDTDSYWVVSLTGCEHVYYTLYLFNKVSGNYTYCRNLSSNIVEAVAKIATSKGLPILLDEEDGNFKTRRIPAVCFQFGKYVGQSLVEVYEKDPQYVLWAAKNVLPKNKVQRQMLDNLQAIVKSHFQMLTEKNKEECSSEYYGQIKTRYDLTLKVYQVNEYINEFERSLSYRHRATDESGNLFQFYYKEPLDKDTAFKLRGTVTRHQEYVGRKFTIINRVKIES